MIEGDEATIEDLDFLDGGRGLNLQYDGYLIGICFNSSLSDQVPEKFVKSYPDGTLRRVKLLSLIHI